MRGGSPVDLRLSGMTSTWTADTDEVGSERFNLVEKRAMRNIVDMKFRDTCKW